MKKTKQPQIKPAEAAGEPYITKAEVGRRLAIKPRTVDAWLRSGRLVHFKLGRAVRFKWSDVDAHLTATCRVIRGQ